MKIPQKIYTLGILALLGSSFVAHAARPIQQVATLSRQPASLANFTTLATALQNVSSLSNLQGSYQANILSTYGMSAADIKAGMPGLLTNIQAVNTAWTMYQATPGGQAEQQALINAVDQVGVASPLLQKLFGAPLLADYNTATNDLAATAAATTRGLSTEKTDTWNALRNFNRAAFPAGTTLPQALQIALQTALPAGEVTTILPYIKTNPAMRQLKLLDGTDPVTAANLSLLASQARTFLDLEKGAITASMGYLNVPAVQTLTGAVVADNLETQVQKAVAAITNTEAALVAASTTSGLPFAPGINTLQDKANDLIRQYQGQVTALRTRAATATNAASDPTVLAIATKIESLDVDLIPCKDMICTAANVGTLGIPVGDVSLARLTTAVNEIDALFTMLRFPGQTAARSGVQMAADIKTYYQGLGAAGGGAAAAPVVGLNQTTLNDIFNANVNYSINTLLDPCSIDKIAGTNATDPVKGAELTTAIRAMAGTIKKLATINGVTIAPTTPYATSQELSNAIRNAILATCPVAPAAPGAGVALPLANLTGILSTSAQSKIDNLLQGCDPATFAPGGVINPGRLTAAISNMAKTIHGAAGTLAPTTPMDAAQLATAITLNNKRDLAKSIYNTPGALGAGKRNLSDIAQLNIGPGIIDIADLTEAALSIDSLNNFRTNPDTFTSKLKELFYNYYDLLDIIDATDKRVGKPGLTNGTLSAINTQCNTIMSRIIEEAGRGEVFERLGFRINVPTTNPPTVPTIANIVFPAGYGLIPTAGPAAPAAAGITVTEHNAAVTALAQSLINLCAVNPATPATNRTVLVDMQNDNLDALYATYFTATTPPITLTPRGTAAGFTPAAQNGTAASNGNILKNQQLKARIKTLVTSLLPLIYHYQAEATRLGTGAFSFTIRGKKTAFDATIYDLTQADITADFPATSLVITLVALS